MPDRLFLAIVLGLTLAFLTAACTPNAHAAAPDPTPFTTGDPTPDDNALHLHPGGQFVRWEFTEADASGLFREAGGGASTTAPLKIAWLFTAIDGTWQWTAYIPALGETDFTVSAGDILWLVAFDHTTITPFPL